MGGTGTTLRPAPHLWASVLHCTKDPGAPPPPWTLCRQGSSCGLLDTARTGWPQLLPNTDGLDRAQVAENCPTLHWGLQG